MSVEANQLLDIARRVLNTMGVYDYTDLRLTYAQKLLDQWKANFSFMRPDGIIKSVGCFTVDAETEEITGMWLDREWK